MKRYRSGAYTMCTYEYLDEENINESIVTQKIEEDTEESEACAVSTTTSERSGTTIEGVEADIDTEQTRKQEGSGVFNDV